MNNTHGEQERRDRNAYAIEEYKQVFQLVVDIERRLLQVFAGTTTIGVTLLTAAAALMMSSTRRPFTASEAYILLIPILLLIPSFYVVLGLRTDIAMSAGYLVVFFEEAHLGPRWNASLRAFRNPRRSESNDPIPFTYWVLSGSFVAMFIGAINEAQVRWTWHVWPLLPLVSLLAHVHYKWRRALYQHLSESIESWRRVHSADFEPQRSEA